MSTEDARIGARVGEGSGYRSVWRGLTGTVSGYWENPEYLVLDVKLEEISERAWAGSYAHGKAGSVT
jgi:hypothetical protein